MNWHDRQGMIADINLRIELKRLADKVFERDDGPLMAILEVAISTLDERISDPDAYPTETSPRRRPVTLICRNIRIRNKRTSVKLENEFWNALDMMASEAHCTIDDLCDTARRSYESSSLTSAIRVFVLNGTMSLPAKSEIPA
ncbi:MAG: ribbon-helix-helix domain-containing protein [Magnetospirillum sp.]|nr:ribbon-helix-helix domain-containing protein [Magnetospirillum sp.]